MGELMHDALGVGLAATQVGVLHRVLVYRVDAEDAGRPRSSTRCSSGQRGARDRRGGLSRACPACTSRSSARRDVRVRAQDATGEELDDRGRGPGGARDPARDRPPRRHPDPRSRSRARRARRRCARCATARRAGGRAALSAARRGPSRTRSSGSAIMRTVFLGTSEFAAAVLERLAAGEHRPALVLTRPDRPRGRGRGWPRRRWPTARARWASRSTQPDERERRRRRASGSRAARPDACGRVRVRRADQGAAAVRARDAERAPVAAAALARRRADRARDHGRRRANGRLDHAPHRGPRQRARVPGCERADRAGRHLRLARRAPADARWRAARAGARPGRARRAAAVRRAGRGGRHLRREDRPRGPPARPGRPAVELERVVRALHPHIGARVALADGTLLGVRAARAARRPHEPPTGDASRDGRPSMAAAGVLAHGERLLYGAADGRRSSYARAAARRAAPMDAARISARTCPSDARASAPTRCCGACSSTAPTPTARCTARRERLDARDRALAMRLAYGAVQRTGTLDHLIEQLAERPPRAARRAAAGGAAARAVRAAATCAARPTTRSSPTRSSSPRRGARGGHGLVNAVLRRAAREGRALLAALDDDDARAARRSSTRTRSGSRGCGGRSWAPSRRAR